MPHFFPFNFNYKESIDDCFLGFVDFILVVYDTTGYLKTF